MNWDNIKNLDPSMPEWEELEQLNRRVSSLQNTYMKTYEASAADAREAAAAEEAKRQGWTVKEVESACAYYRAAKARLNRTANGDNQMTTTATDAPVEKQRKPVFKDLYRAMAMEHGVIGPDWMTEHFGSSFGMTWTQNTVSVTRAELTKKEGFEFEKVEHGCWQVTRRPSKYTSEQIENARVMKSKLDELLKDMRRSGLDI